MRPRVSVWPQEADLEGGWKEFSATFTVPDAFTPASYNLFIEFPAPGTYWIDDVSFSKQ